MSERVCNYASPAPPDNLSSSDLSTCERFKSPGDACGQAIATVLDDDGALNLFHTELLIHLIQDKDIFDLGHVDLNDVGVDSYFSNVSSCLQIGLKWPFLLHQVLAFSARHLAFLHAARSASYAHLAFVLQTRAISLFNIARLQPDRSNCVAMVVFASVLGHHVLADTLAKRSPGGLEAFLTNYMLCVGMHKGIYSVAVTAWPLLQESELQPIMSWSSEFSSRTPKGNHCAQVSAMVEGAVGLSEGEKKACRQAIQLLQVGLDAVTDPEEQPGQRYQMIVSWTMVVGPEYTRLLAAKRPEALILLAYYAVLLHYGRKLWQVQDAGAYVLSIIVDYLEPEWHHWLECPREMIIKDAP
jgi:hypothetical protein